MTKSLNFQISNLKIKHFQREISTFHRGAPGGLGNLNFPSYSGGPWWLGGPRQSPSPPIARNSPMDILHIWGWVSLCLAYDYLG